MISNIKQFEDLSEIEIKQRILCGEINLFEILIRKYNAHLYKVGRSYGYTHEDVQDLMQETFISAYLCLAKFENRSSFKTWIIRIMLNMCYHKFHKASFKNELTQTTAIKDKSTPMYASHQYTDTDKVVVNRELNHVIETCLEKLPLDYRLVFSLREINGLNVAETADILDISESNVKVRLNRVKTMLRKEIEKIYTAEDIFEFNLIYCDRMVSRVMNKIRTVE